MTGLLPLASFSFDTAPTPAADLGAKGEPRWIPIDKLRIDDSYQRPIDVSGKKNIRRIIEQFKWHKFAPIVVSPREGDLYAVVDGQHRAVACALHGAIKEVPCLVLACSQAEEAEAFATINGLVTRMHPQYLFRARIAAGDPGASAANEAALAAGVRIMPYPAAAPQLKVGETLAGKTIEIELARVGRPVLVAALELITRTGAGNAGMVKAVIIEAFCDVYATHPKWLAAQDECRRLVHRRTVKDIYATACQRQAVAGGSLRPCIGAVLSEVLAESIGDGGKTENPLRIERATKAAEAKKGNKYGVGRANPGEGGNLGALRVTDTRRPNFALAPSKDQVSTDDRALIDAHLASKGARKLESAATGHTSNILDWLKLQGFDTRRRSTNGAHGGKIFEIDGKAYDLAGLFVFTNKIRVKMKLEPLTIGAPMVDRRKTSGASW